MHSAEILALEPDTLPTEPEPAPSPSPDAPEHIRCKWWRENVVNLSRPRLAELTGFSISTIADIEAGHNRSTKAPVDAAVMQRYRMTCAAVTLGVEFDWLSLRLIPDAPVEIRMFQGKRK
jgi:hypothetical protein